MKHRAPRAQWGVLVASLLVLGCLAAFVAVRFTAPSAPRDFGDSAVASSAVGAASSSRSPRAAADDAPAGPSSIASPGPSRAAQAPRLLVIPRLAITARIDPVGVADDGEVEVPEDARRVGWYRFGPAPGAAEGSAVIVGHVDSQTQGLGVLAGLNDVRENDRVEIRAAGGGTTAYRIVSRQTVDKKSLSGSGVFRRDGSPVLTLVTCAGPYLKDRGGYQDNLVVTAVPDISG